MDPGSYRGLWFLAELLSWKQEIYLPVKQEDCLYMAQRTPVPCTWVDGFQASEVQRGEQQKDGGCLASQQSWL